MQFGFTGRLTWASDTAVRYGDYLGGDTAAYFVGRSFGKYKLAPHLSPNKTWEGTVASFLGSLIVAVVLRGL